MPWARLKKTWSACTFLLRAERTPVFCTCELASPQRRERRSFRRTRVRIEFDIASRTVSHPRSLNNKKVYQTDALASRGSDILYGVRRHVWDRRNHSWRGVWPRDPDPAVSAARLEPADNVHDRRTVERLAC